MAEEIENTNKKQTAAGKFRDVVSGKVLFNVLLEKQRGYVLLFFVLAIVYITQHYFMERTVREVKRLEYSLDSLHIEYTIRSAELVRLSKRSTVERELERRNMTLKVPQRPPKRITMD
jgi:hypothetical protein